jgi:heme/copper-type cytochrome/quinol oxidase subunit 1
MYLEYNLYNEFEYIFGILFFVSIRVFILNTFKKYYSQVWTNGVVKKTWNSSTTAVGQQSREKSKNTNQPSPHNGSKRKDEMTLYYFFNNCN